MLWFHQNIVWLAPALYALASECIAHSSLKSNSVTQLIMAGIKSMLPAKVG